MTSNSPEIETLVQRTRLGRPIGASSVVMVPLLFDGDLDADLLRDTVASGVTIVTEVDGAGSVNEILLRHSGPRSLLLLHGEEVIGAKQNRIFNASFLIPPGGEVKLPVSCVERGRWGYDSPTFRSSGATAVSSVRRSSLDRVSHSLSSRSSYDAGQSGVWDDVDSYLTRSGVSSETSSLADGVRARRGAVRDALRDVRVGDDWAGVAFVRGDKIVGLDLFGSARVFRRAWSTIAVGVLADVFEGPVETGDPQTAVANALQLIGGTPVMRNQGIGMGETLHGSGRLNVGAIANQGHVYHLYAASAP